MILFKCTLFQAALSGVLGGQELREVLESHRNRKRAAGSSVTLEFHVRDNWGVGRNTSVSGSERFWLSGQGCCVATIDGVGAQGVGRGEADT